MTDATFYEGAHPDWVSTLRRYVLFSAAGHLVWEAGHIPLYTIWVEGSWGEIVFAIVHCTGGDLLIAMSALFLALFVVGDASWPLARRHRVLIVALVFGIGYTIFSEWLNIVIRAAWADRDIMPVVPVIDAGLTPLLQWIVVPTAAYFGAIGTTSTRRADAGAGR